jgi:hypothetical protein
MDTRGEDIIGRTLRATDGEIGKVRDLYFIAAKLTRKQVKESPGVETDRPVSRADWPSHSVHLRLSRDEVKKSPEYGG